MDLVLVHGLAGSSRWWAPVVPALAERHRVHVLDVPRLRPGGDPAAWLEERVARLERPLLVGHSLGGLLCAAAAARAPARVRGVALVAPAGLPLGRSPLTYGLPLASALRLAGPRFLARLAADAARAGPLSLALGARYALASDLTNELSALAQPTLLVWGDRDPLVRPDLAERWLDALPDGRLVLLRGVGHVPMRERPAELAGALLDFVEELEREPR